MEAKLQSHGYSCETVDYKVYGFAPLCISKTHCKVFGPSLTNSELVDKVELTNNTKAKLIILFTR